MIVWRSIGRFWCIVAFLPRSRACNNLHWTETDLGRFSQERPRFLCISETSSNRSKSLMMSICVHRLTLQWARIWNEKIFLNDSTRQRENGNLLAQKLLWFLILRLFILQVFLLVRLIAYKNKTRYDIRNYISNEYLKVMYQVLCYKE